MPNYICVTCGCQYHLTLEPPSACMICEDERQYVNPNGQRWTTLDALVSEYHNELILLEPNLTEIRTMPRFGIGQRALLVQTAQGNVLWDCISLIDQATIDAISALGGISALAMSHPHMYGTMVEWSHAFGNVPIYVHHDDQAWLPRPDPVVEFWSGESHELENGLTLHRCGGHFEGAAVLLWSAGAEGRGALLSSDTIFVTPDRRHVAFMYSYPNYIPLGMNTVERIVVEVTDLPFDRMYGNFHGLNLNAGAKEAVHRSVERFKQAIGC